MADRHPVSRRAVLGAGLTLLAGASSAGRLALTPANPEGPFYPVHDALDRDADLTRVPGRSGRARGQVIRVVGRVLAPDGTPLPDALVDVWQANSFGRYQHPDDPSTQPHDPDFQYWAQVRTGADGGYGYTTIRPAAYEVGPGMWRPPHIHYRVSAPGHESLTTQLYFAGERLNARDGLLRAVPEADRARLVVDFTGGDVPHGIFDVVLAPVQPA